MKKLGLGCLLLWLFVELAQSQTTMQNLQNQLKTAKKNNYRVLFHQINEELAEMPIQEALVKAQENIKIAQKLPLKNILPLAYNQLAKIYLDKYKNQKGIDSCLKYAQQAYQIAKDGQMLYEIADVASVLANIYTLQGVSELSLQYALESSLLYEQMNYTKQATESYYNIGMINYQIENLAKAKEYFLKAADAKEYIKSRQLINTWNSLGLIEQKQKSYSQALNYFKEAIQIAENQKDTVWIGIISGNMGEVMGELGDYEQAQKLLQVDVISSLKYNEINNAINSLRVSGDFYFRQKLYQEAQNQYIQALHHLSSITGHPMPRLGLFLSLARFYQHLKKFEEAFQYQKMAMETQELIFRQNKEKEIQKIMTVNDLKRKQAENEALRSKNKTQEILIKSRNFQQIIFIISILALFVFALILHQINRQRRKSIILLHQQNFAIRQQNEKIESQRDEIAAQNEDLQQKQEEIISQRDVIERKNRELESVNYQLNLNEQALRQNNEQLQKNEEIIKSQSLILFEYNQNLEKEVKERTEELVEKNQELISYSHQLEQFAYITAHNIRAPISRMLGLASIFDKKNLASPQNLVFIEKMQLVAQEMDTIIRDLNVILEVKKGLNELIEEVDLRQKLKKVQQILEPQIQESGAKIRVDFKGGYLIQSVGIYCESILYNLLSNAIKYRNPVNDLEIKLNTTQEADYLIVTVSDNGLGIDIAKYGEKLFGLYKRFHDHVEGKGLGLHLVKLQVEALGGKIEVESQLQIGTTFRIYLKNTIV